MLHENEANQWITCRFSEFLIKLCKKKHFLGGSCRNITFFWGLCRNITVLSYCTSEILCRAFFRGCAEILIFGEIFTSAAKAKIFQSWPVFWKIRIVHMFQPTQKLTTIFLSWWGEAAFSSSTTLHDKELIWPESSCKHWFVHIYMSVKIECLQHSCLDGGKQPSFPVSPFRDNVLLWPTYLRKKSSQYRILYSLLPLPPVIAIFEESSRSHFLAPMRQGMWETFGQSEENLKSQEIIDLSR